MRWVWVNEPSFSATSAAGMKKTSTPQSHPEVDDLLTSLSAPHELLVGVLPRASAFDHPPFGGRYGSWFALLRDVGSQAVSCQLLAGSIGIVGAVEVYACLVGQLS
jgi:hypothetical protein